MEIDNFNRTIVFSDVMMIKGAVFSKAFIKFVVETNIKPFIPKKEFIKRKNLQCSKKLSF